MSKIEVNAIEPQCGTDLTVGASGDTITFPTGTTIVNNGSQTGFGRTGTVDWQTGSIKTSTFTAANGEGYFANTSGGAFTMNLPAGVVGNIVSVVDYTNTFQTNNLTISPNGTEKIGGINADSILSTEGQSVTLVYVDATEGWKNTMDSTSNITGNPFIQASVSGAGNTLATAPDCANYNIATFTGPGSFTVSAAAVSAPNNSTDYLIVAGGGSGGTSCGGGGGAGGFRTSFSAPATPVTVTAQAYPIVVGGGAAGRARNNPIPGGIAANGGNSSGFGLTATGGGPGGEGCVYYGGPGGSGGGGGQGPFSGTGNYYNGPATVGQGNTPSVPVSQGNNGGTGWTRYNLPSGNTKIGGGGGGGAAAVGSPMPPSGGEVGAAGGAGSPNSITGSAVNYAGGGGGGTLRQGPTTPIAAGSGGIGGGGPGGSCGDASGPVATNGTGNTGGGGGGGGNDCSPASRTAGLGGSGIVIIRYKAR